MRRLLLLLVVLVILALPTGAEAHECPYCGEPANGQWVWMPFKEFILPEIYQVQPGDRLWRIAQDFGVTIDDLVLWNDNIEDPNLIIAWDVIYVEDPDDVMVIYNEPIAPAIHLAGVVREVEMVEVPAPIVVEESVTPWWAWLTLGYTLGTLPWLLSRLWKGRKTKERKVAEAEVESADAEFAAACESVVREEPPRVIGNPSAEDIAASKAFEASMREIDPSYGFVPGGRRSRDE